jgi:hypothetical protein
MAKLAHDIAVVAKCWGIVRVFYQDLSVAFQRLFRFVLSTIVIALLDYVWDIHGNIYVVATDYFIFSINTSQRNTAFYAVNPCVAARTRIGLL